MQRYIVQFCSKPQAPRMQTLNTFRIKDDWETEPYEEG